MRGYAHRGRLDLVAGARYSGARSGSHRGLLRHGRRLDGHARPQHSRLSHGFRHRDRHQSHGWEVAHFHHAPRQVRQCRLQAVADHGRRTDSRNRSRVEMRHVAGADRQGRSVRSPGLSGAADPDCLDGFRRRVQETQERPRGAGPRADNGRVGDRYRVAQDAPEDQDPSR